MQLPASKNHRVLEIVVDWPEPRIPVKYFLVVFRSLVGVSFVRRYRSFLERSILKFRLDLIVIDSGLRYVRDVI